METFFSLVAAAILFTFAMKEFNNNVHRKELKFYVRLLLCAMVFLWGYFIIKFYMLIFPISQMLANVLTGVVTFGTISFIIHLEKVYPYKK
ncbi:hypothetical protein [Bacillus thuringiensis]|uniref:hypothetical protein n=1 Tax=Bacillus thuringiensis TaxID=1428 RepID=UPI002E178EEE|nr:hypothetical protein [Bacillus thuringiensis]